MTIDSFDALYLSATFLVPGLIFYVFLTGIIPLKTEKDQSVFLKYLSIGCLNFAIWSWLIILIHKSPFFTGSPFKSALAWVFIIFISPAVGGIFVAYLHQKEIVQDFFDKCGLFALHIIPTAWDYKFSKTKHPVSVLLTLIDDSQISGIFGTESFASSSETERDIYLEEVFNMDADNNWVAAENPCGLLITGDIIKMIQFYS